MLVIASTVISLDLQQKHYFLIVPPGYIVKKSKRIPKEMTEYRSSKLQHSPKKENLGLAVDGVRPTGLCRCWRQKGQGVRNAPQVHITMGC